MRRTLGILCILAPFVAAVLGAASARRDVRLAGMAIAATLVVWLILGNTGRGLLAFAGGTAAAAAVALIAGARSPVGVIAVAVVVAGFATVGKMLVGERSTIAQ
jgi:hypothetical protein